MKQVVRVAPRSGINSAHVSYYDQFVFTALDAGLDVCLDESLQSVCWSAFEFAVGDTLAVFDYSDYILIDGPRWNYQHWFKRHFTSGHHPYEHIHSFPILNCCDWVALREVSQEGEYAARGKILHKQKIIAAPLNFPDTDLSERRTKARQLLLAAWGDELDTTIEPSQREFFRAALRCLVSVHIPGTWQHEMDRGIAQCWRLGVCTISPELHTCPCGERPVRWQHFVPIADDFSDLNEKVEWCRANQTRCIDIGRQSRQFFLRTIEPASVWRHALDIMHVNTVQ